MHLQVVRRISDGKPIGCPIERYWWVEGPGEASQAAEFLLPRLGARGQFRAWFLSTGFGMGARRWKCTGTI